MNARVLQNFQVFLFSSRGKHYIDYTLSLTGDKTIGTTLARLLYHLIAHGC